MQRRKFIRQSAISAAAMLLIPEFLASCKKEMLLDGEAYTGKVIIVGAGAAGMYAAYLLNLKGVNVTVLEASQQYGGRIKSLQNFTDFDIDLGAEKICGEHSLWYDLVSSSDIQFIDSLLNDYYYFNGNLKTKSEAEENTFFNVMIQKLNEIDSYSSGDVTAETYSNVSGISNNVDPIFNALLGNRHGTSNNRIGMFGLREEQEKKTSGNKSFSVKNSSLLRILETRFSEVLSKIQTNTPITAIDYSGAKIILTDNNNQTYEADKVIVTVPLPILQQGLIQFSPDLSQERKNAFQKIGMDSGYKIILKFDERIWPENTGSIFGNGYIPEFWPVSEGGRSNSSFALAAFVMGEKAEQLALLGDQIIPTVLAEIDVLFPGSSTHYIDHYIQDWGSEPFIRGAYSYPKPGTSTAREVIAQPIGSKVYFAGEATHTKGHFATVHGAMETGLRAVTELFES